MPTSAMKAFLKQNSTDWGQQATTAKEQPGFERLPDNRYMMQLTGAELTESNAGDPMIKWEYTVITGEYEGELQFDYDGLTREDAFLWLARKFNRLGYDPTQIKLTQLESALEELVSRNIIIKGRLKTAKSKTDPDADYQNLRIEKVMPEGWAPDADEDDEPAPAPRRASAPAPAPAPISTTKKKAAPAPVENDDEDEDDDEDEAPAPPVKKKAAPAPVENDDEDEDDDTEAPAPAPKRGRGRPPKAAPAPAKKAASTPAPAPAKKAAPAPAPEPEDDDEDDGEQVEIEVGMKASFVRTFTKDGVKTKKKLTGEIVEVPEDEDGDVTVQVGTNQYEVAVDQITIIDEGTDA